MTAALSVSERGNEWASSITKEVMPNWLECRTVSSSERGSKRMFRSRRLSAMALGCDEEIERVKEMRWCCFVRLTMERGVEVG